MHIKVLGTRGEIKPSAPRHRKKSGVLIDNHLLFDVGDEDFLAANPSHIFITHLHPDHAYFVRHHEHPSIAATIYAPETYEGMHIHVLHKPVHIGNYLITPIPTLHSLKVASQAYLLEHNKKKVLYTGDMIWIEKKYHHLLKNIDLVITEASYIRQGGMVRKDQATGIIFGHTGIPDLIRLFKPATSKLLLVHFGSWFFQDIAQARHQIEMLARENSLDVIIGYDGLELDI